MKKQISLFFIIILAFFLRFYGINWDGGFHLHPDERMLIMVAERISFFDQLNPHFFNYGSLPIYILKGLASFLDVIFKLNITNYNGMLYLGRFLSIFFDILTIIFIFKIAKILFPNIKYQISNIPIFSSFFYAIAFFPIQNSHFFISDVFLTSFTTLLMFLLLKFFDNFFNKVRDKNFIGWVILISGVFGAMAATKFPGIIFYPIVVSVIILASKKMKDRMINLFAFHFSFLIFHFLFMPYAFIDHKQFINDILTQIRMNSNPYVFPYTLQYVGTTPYVYYLKNIFFWGMGPIISILALSGLIFLFKDFLTSKFSKKNSKFKLLIITFLFYGLYFLIIGRSSVKFMRYMLPIYPFLSLMAGYGITKISNFKFLIYKQTPHPKSQIPHLAILPTIFLILSLFWTLMFVAIYSQPNTRLLATEWIINNIPYGSTLAVEHWDDQLPLFGGEKYNFVEMTLYDQPDDEKKWHILNEKLRITDYIIISSNRLYVPLQKLADCQKYRVCYPKTAQYYQKLFNGSLGFKKIAEFSVYPKFSIFNFQFLINDQSADESFTVYDHPKVMVFKKI